MISEDDKEWFETIEKGDDEMPHAMLDMMEEVLIEMEGITEFAREERIKYADESLLQQLEWHQNQIQLLADEVREKMENDGTEPLTNRRWGR